MMNADQGFISETLRHEPCVTENEVQGTFWKIVALEAYTSCKHL